MELTDLPMFGLVRRRLGWLHQRQEVTAQNIANADTPKYQSHDVKTFDFRDELKRHQRTNPATQPVSLSLTNSKHIAHASSSGRGDFAVRDDRRPYETSPDGNKVVLEEQMVRMNETQANHSAMTQLYRKHLGMFKSLVRGGGGG